MPFWQLGLGRAPALLLATYTVLLFIAFISSLWRRVMDKRLDRVTGWARASLRKANAGSVGARTSASGEARQA